MVGVHANWDAWLWLLRRAPRGGPHLWRWGGPAGLIMGGAALAAVIAILMFTVDAPAILAARGLPTGIRRVFGIITDFGKSGWVLWPVGVVLVALCFTTSRRLGRTGELVVLALSVRLTCLFAAVAVPGLFTAIVKDIIGRARPFVGGSANPFLYHPFAWKPAYASLPSGHSTTVVAIAVAVSLLWPRSRPYAWLYALMILASRVIITAHHPSDVIAGAAVGATGAVLVCRWFAARRLALTIAPDGALRAMPGPSWRRLKRVAAGLFRQ